MSVNDDKDIFTWASLRGTWEYKTLAVIMRLCVASVVFFYVVFSFALTLGWGEGRYIKLRNIEAFGPVLEKAIAENDFQHALRWLSVRKTQDTDALRAQVEAHAENLPAPFFMTMAGRMDDAQRPFWTVLGRYRLRFDVLRCGGRIAVDAVQAEVERLYELLGTDPVMDDIEADPLQMAALLQEVLNFDATHPARNDPDMMCKIVEGMKDMKGLNLKRAQPQSWATIRHILRTTTEKAIAEMKK